jgi:hypothetical protein
MSNTLRYVAITAALALTVAGTVHLVDAPGAFREAAYLGLSFVAQFTICVLAAAGILLGSRFAWIIGALVSAATIVMYVISRTVGLPGQSGEGWLGWAGVVSTGSEIIALAATLWGLRLLRTTPAGRPVGPSTR